MSTLHALNRTAAALALFSCLAATVQAQDRVVAVGWMTGCWAAEGKEYGTGEAWLAPAGGTMLGLGRTVRAGKTVDFEYMQIRVDTEGRLVFTALPSGKRETTFVASAVGQENVVFENPSHDFPKMISYRKTGPETIVARIEGVRDGVERGIDFPTRRTSCELPK